MSLDLFSFRKDIFELDIIDTTLIVDGKIELKHITLQFSTDSFFHLKGDIHSGSVLLKMLAGLTPPQFGHYLVNGESVAEMSFQEFLPYRLNLGLGFSQGGVLNNRTLHENLLLPFLFHSVPQDKAELIISEAFQLLGIKKFHDRRPADVPGYVRKLLCLCRLMTMNPQVLLLDDPVSGLPKEPATVFRQWIQRRRDAGDPLIVILTGEDTSLFDGVGYYEIVLDDGEVTDFNVRAAGLAV